MLSGGLSPQSFRRLSALVRERSGIALSDDKRMLVANRLRKHVTELGYEAYDPYSDYVLTSGAAAEIDTLIELLVTNHTSFFREPEHFRLLSEEVLPELASSSGPVRLWSAAASSGEEVYTMAMVVAEASRQIRGLDCRITGSDISRRMLAIADKGVYPLAALDPVGPVFTKRYFQRGISSQNGRCRAQADLRSRVRFRRINLLDSSYPVGGRQHVIFCRNVMIYFDAEVRAQTIDRLTDMLVPGGYLFVGYSESLGAHTPGLEPAWHGVYRRI
jgi:chemotaxis protein methyltransferase CheR